MTEWESIKRDFRIGIGAIILAAAIKVLPREDEAMPMWIEMLRYFRRIQAEPKRRVS